MNCGRLANIRKSFDVSQTELARRLNITRQAYNNYETGRREPDNEILSKIADFFDVSTDYLLGRTDDKKNKPTTSESDELIKLLQEPINREFFELLNKVSPKTREGALAQLRVLAGLEDNQ